MSDNMIAILIQIPIVAAFMWYTMRMAREFQEYVASRDVAWQETVEKLSEAIDRISTQLQRNTAAILLSARKGNTDQISKVVLDELRDD
jgi:hypothetical protein